MRILVEPYSVDLIPGLLLLVLAIGLVAQAIGGALFLLRGLFTSSGQHLAIGLMGATGVAIFLPLFFWLFDRWVTTLP